MTSHSKTLPVNWCGDEHQVTIEWKIEGGEVSYIRCLIGRKEVVSLYQGRWSNPKKKRFDSSHFVRLVRCCRDNFAETRHINAALMPVFSIFHGEEL